jgi:hypothetical protein
MANMHLWAYFFFANSLPKSGKRLIAKAKLSKHQFYALEYEK